MLASRTITTRQSKKKQTVDETKNMLIGFISWNIQNNINQSKMDELIQKYFYNVELEPDLVIVALQEVPVDIAITKTRKSFKEKFYKKIGDMLSNSLKSYTIIDSYDKPSNSFFTSTNTKQKNLNLFTCANIVSGVAGGYGIVTYIFKREHLTIPIIPTAVKERCIDQTKGYCVVTLQIGDNQSIDIVNTHMPFRDEKTTSSFTNEMLRWLRVHNFRSDAQVVLGDLNSRSLLTPECYAKNITTCEDDDQSKYCFIKDYLENMTLDESIVVDPAYSKVRLTKLTKDNCDISDRISKNRLLDGNDLYKTQAKDMIRILLKSDVLHTKMNTLFPGFREDIISFLPTYKRDESTGKFSLLKKESSTVHGRLPGYADRILFKGKMFTFNSHYMPLSVVGNDHLPIASMVQFKLSDTNQHIQSEEPEEPEEPQESEESEESEAPLQSEHSEQLEKEKRTKTSKIPKRKKNTATNKILSPTRTRSSKIPRRTTKKRGGRSKSCKSKAKKQTRRLKRI